ncbi:MAG: DUF2273 domain-containing protein [Clostridiales bacterium]|nr:DUF2273 domain-containing protein [Clostridiales bacterium]
MKEKFLKLLEDISPYKFRIIGFITGLIIAILLLTIGFFKTLLVVICITIGLVLGYFFDDKVDFGSVVDKILSRVKGDK